MDITNIPQNLIKALEQKNTEQLAVLSRVLNLIVGKTVIASVASTAPVTAAEREELLKQTATALSQLSQQSVEKLTPALKTEIARLMQQQNLIQSPELKWINLVVNNRPLLTYSDRTLTAGQTIPVQLQSPQKLVLLDLPELDPNKSASGKAQVTIPLITAPTTNNPAGTSNNFAATNKTTETNKTAETPNKPAGVTNNPTTNNPIRTISLTDPTDQAKTTSLTETKNALAVNELLKSAIAELTNKTVTTPANPAKNIVATTADIIPSKSSTPEVTSNKDTQQKAITLNTLLPTTDTPKPAQQHKVNIYSENGLSLKRASQIENKHNTPETTAAKSLISEQLRNILPHRDTPNVLLSAVMQLQNLPAPIRTQLFSPNLEQALKSLAEKIRSPEQLIQPKVLAQTLKNSGVFFENKLTALVPKESIDNHSTNTNTNTNTNTKINNNSSHNNNGKINSTYSQDLKGSLLTLLNRVTQELSGSNKPVTSEQTLKLFQNLGSGVVFNQSLNALPILNNKTDITQNIGVLIQELMHKPVTELSDKELRTQLLVLLQQHSVHSLAKIQLQQLHNVNHELETKDTNAPNASWQLEIPVKHHNDVQHVHLRIDREWINEKQESESEKSNNKIKQWSVTLRFDLPTLGEFCAQLAIVNTQVSATLWAAREKTFTEVREQIEGLRKQLESEGINVKYLQCMRGMPPQKPMALSYSLIDIST